MAVRARQEDGAVIMEVEDECGGLPEGRADELFEPFVQKHAGRGGLGLGLSIARQSVEAHGWSLSVQNFPGKGCMFVVRASAQR